MRIQLGIKVAIATLAAIGAGLVGAGSANASPVYYNIFNYGSSLCLGVASTGYAGQFNCTTNNDQEWTLVNVGAAYEIKNKNGACLYVEGLSQQDGARLKADTTDCNQTWQIGEWSFPGSSFAQTLTAFYTNSGWVAGIDGGSVSSGAHAVIWQHQDPPHENQYWTSCLWNAC
jgi:Ricin-type beta-trefoil lectin domain-like